MCGNKPMREKPSGSVGTSGGDSFTRRRGSRSGFCRPESPRNRFFPGRFMDGWRTTIMRAARCSCRSQGTPLRSHPPVSGHAYGSPSTFPSIAVLLTGRDAPTPSRTVHRCTHPESPILHPAPSPGLISKLHRLGVCIQQHPPAMLFSLCTDTKSAFFSYIPLLP